ncbi:MAG: ABC transporter permease [Candidatus Aminicenantes bacterium]|nr:MAG: ABC transporter permease [Candidatus Aminicenantes bacterium]
MLKHFFLMALRNLQRNKSYSFINIMGLAIGMASSLILIFWAMDELSFDRFHGNSKNIFRIVQERKTDRIFKTPSTPSPLAQALLANYHDIETAARLRHAGIAFTFGDNKEKIYDEDGLFADPEILRIFTFPLLEGNPRTALSDPQSVIITEKMAQVCFGRHDPIGEILTATNGDPFQITGILKNVPNNSHLKFEYVIPSDYLIRKGQSLDRWNSSDSKTYIMLRENVDHLELNHRLERFVQDRVQLSSSRLIFQPLTEIHLRSLEGGGPIVYVSIALILALFILIVACINFINLSTARIGKRSIEVGIKKVIGARRSNLIGQFFGESLVLSIISAILAMGLVYVFLPVLNRLLGKDIGLDILGTVPVIIVIVTVIIFTGVLSGIYPALFLSSFPPIKIFKSFSQSTIKMLNARRFLVVFQFGISLVLILCTLVVSRQLHFIRSKDLGLDKENLVFFQFEDKPYVELETIKHSLFQSPAISGVTATNAPLLWLGIETTNVSWEGQTSENIMNVQIRTVDFDYFQTFGMEMKEGRFFSKDMSTDSKQGFILNESAARAMGLDSPVGKWFSLGDRRGKIIGVVKDFHHHSVHEEIEPVVFLIEPSWNNYVFVRIVPGHTSEAIKFLVDNWKQINQNRSFRLRFFDEEIDSLYRSEKELGRFINILSVLAVFISCLGLFGLVSYATEQRTKEIGIRKVLGASRIGIQILLSTEFIKWVLLANMIAWPISYFFLQKWLQNFAYRTSIGIGDFLFGSGILLAVAMLTVSFQSLRAASADPVKSLRHE